MSKNWKEKLKGQLEEKGITPEGSNSSESSTTTTSASTTPKKPRITTANLQKQIDQLKRSIDQLKKEMTQERIQEKKGLFKSQSIIIKRMGITVLKQYQNKLKSPLAQDVQELLLFLGYNPEQIIKEIKQNKRK